jgi:tRNA (guanine-N7-)-methyltransferase
MQHDPDLKPPQKEDLEFGMSAGEEDQESERNLEDAPEYRQRFLQPGDDILFREWINCTSPVELEIGSGKGLFLTNAAKKNPSHRFIGLEVATRYAVDCQAYVEKHRINNARFFACDAVAVINRDVQASTLHAIHVYFPDPWWKSRHKKRRVLSEQTLKNIERCLIQGGSFHFWTDVLDYYESTLELVEQATALQGPLFVSEPPVTHDMDYRTHFERRTRKNGLPVYRARFVK